MSDQIKNLIHEADKKFGAGMLKFGGDAIKNVPIICSTGSYKLDMALGCGGIPQGRIIEYFGPPSGGKTTLSLHTMKEAQLKYPNKVVAFIDLENSFDRAWATNLGIDCDKLLFAQPDTGEETFNLIEMIIKSENVSFIVVDSVSGMITNAQVEADYGDAQMAQQARLMSQSLPKINNLLKDSFCTVLFINQIRMKIGGYGNPEETQAGMALKFYSSIRCDVRRGEVIGEKTNPEGFITKVKILKNKVGPPFRTIETELYIGPEKFGIDKISEVADLAVVNGIVNKAGAWFKYTFKGNEERWQGKENFVNTIRENPEMYSEIWDQVSKTVLNKDVPVIGSFNDEKVEQEVPKKRKGKKKEEKDPNAESEEIHIEETSTNNIEGETNESKNS